MRAREPIQQILKAYHDILNGSIIYEGNVITVGTKISRRTTNYIHLYVSDIENISTGDQVIYKIIVTLEVVSLQGTTEGDDTIVNAIIDQILEFVEDENMLQMSDFKCDMVNIGGIEDSSELTESNYIIAKEVNMLNFIEQRK